ncbi:MAG TPA: phosphoribosylanthranilate isomerase [Chryseolinea sp.]|nr:phosphoribosylanthranilate isomerase [Flavobacteriales bacterium]HPH47594.1 phosphoribosylanthranilate isomerase [Chryseolinea sp.]HPM32806.1 phosphoribosylanthranilate isomerase [Chryseolinea sp.]
MKVKLKICGMRDANNIMEVASLKPDYFGFIFYPKSPRFVADDFILPVKLSPDILRVGVFVNETSSAIIEKAKTYPLDYIQLHGSETPEQCQALRQLGLGIIKVFSVGDDFDFEITKPYKSVADYFLFDTKGKHHGGNASTFNWDLLKQYDQDIPFFLSGGLSPENMNEVAKLDGMNIHALDVNSGVEASPGVKDISKLKQLINHIELIAKD